MGLYFGFTKTSIAFRFHDVKTMYEPVSRKIFQRKGTACGNYEMPDTSDPMFYLKILLFIYK